MVYTFDDAEGGGPPHDPVFRDLRQSRASTTTAGWPAPSTGRPGSRSRAVRCRRTSGNSTTRVTTSAWPTTWRRRTRRSSRRCRTLFMKEAVASTTCCPSTTASSSASIASMAGRPDLMGGRTSLTLYEGMTGMTENVFINIKNRSHYASPPRWRSRGRRQRRDPRPGRPVRRLEPLPEGRQADLRLQLPGPEAITRSRRPRSCLRRARPRSASSSPMTAAASARAARARSSSTARRSPRAGSSRRNAACSRSTKAPTSGARSGTPVTADFQSPFAFTGKIDKVTIALSDKADDERSKAEPASEENRKKRSLAD